MNNLYIGFSKPIKFKVFSWLIRKFQSTEYSHVYLRFYSSKYQRHLVYQSSATMVNFMEWMRFISINEIVKEFEVPITEECRTSVVSRAIDLVGAPYGIKQVIGIAYVELLKKFNILVSNPFSDKEQSWVCSEIVADALKELGLIIDKDFDSVTPRDIYTFLEIKLNGEN